MVQARPIAELLQARLLERGETLACAESLTGGLLATALSQAPGASAVFVGGVVSYATEVKRSVLDVTAPRVISAECATQMAAGVRTLMGSDWALSTTGVAGPDLQEDQPVGTVFVGIATASGASAVELCLAGDRDQIRADAVREAVGLLVEALASAGPTK